METSNAVNKDRGKADTFQLLSVTSLPKMGLKHYSGFVQME